MFIVQGVLHHVPGICGRAGLPHLPKVPALPTGKAVNREDKQSRRYRDRHFGKFERSPRFRDRYRC